MSDSLIPPFGKPFHLGKQPTRANGGLTKEQGLAELVVLQRRLDELQELLYADSRWGLLIILQAIDAGGKDGTIRAVFDQVDPLGIRTVAFKVPSEDELARDFLWRVHNQVPAKGETVIFNRSHYEDVLVVRVNNLVPEKQWRKRYDHINAFERLLVDEGTIILKFFLHVSREEQRRRLQERIDDPRKRWKFRQADLNARAQWDDYQRAFETMIDRCNTDWAPWHVVPADNNWHRNVLVARTIVQKLESLDLRYPDPEPGIVGTRVE
jgi:PPK2 family polyphosphate:nucleotide phosphotransferase